MNARLLIVALAVLAATAALWALLADPGAGASDAGSRSEVSAPRAGGAEELSGLEADPVAVVEERAEATDVSSAAHVADAEAAADDEKDDCAHIVGRLLLPSGAPAAGAALEVRGFRANSDRVAKFGVPASWEDPTGTAGADGRFDIAFEAPRAYQFFLDATLQGHAELSWRWGELLPGSTTDVGDQTFSPACTIAGRVVDTEGEPTGIAWTVYADSAVGAKGGGSDETRVRASVDPPTGRFELEGLPPGPVTLKAYSRATNWIDGPFAEAKLDRVTEVELVYDGPDIRSTITVSTSCRPFHTHSNPVDGRIVARGPDGAEHVAERVAGSSQSHQITGLAPGPYTIAIESAVHEPWSRAGVQPGETVNARLVGSASATLTVVDAATSAPVEGYRVRARHENSTWRPNEFTLVDFDDERPVGGLLEGLLPIDTTLVVDAEGYATCEVPLGEVAAGSVAAAEARMERGASLTVTVVDAAGRPAPGAKVSLYPFTEGYEPGARPTSPEGFQLIQSIEQAMRTEETDGAGVVRFESVSPGDHGAFAQLGDLLAATPRLTISDGEDAERRLELPPSGALEGRVVGLAPEVAGGLWAVARAVDAADRWPPRGARDGAVELDAEGRFRIEGLGPGAHTVALLTPMVMLKRSTTSASGTQPQRVPLGEVEITAGAVTSETFDLSDRAPGTVVVEARVNGEPARGLTVQLSAVAGNATAGGSLDAEGRHVESPVFPGAWKVRIWPLDGTWGHEHPEPFEVAPGERVTVRVDLEIGRGRLVVRDAATGEPAAGKTVFANGVRVRLDDEGAFERAFAVGTVGLSGKWDPFSEAPPPVSVLWGPDGPNVEEVTLAFD